jgi:hypothetical protein
MKPPSLLWRLASIPMLLAVANCSAEGTRGDVPPESADTRRILSSIDQAAPRRTEADRQAAARLNRDADAAYLKGDYRAALSAYSNSYPNYPTAHAYILAGDAHWRAALQLARSRATPASASSPMACALSNEHFPRDLLMGVQQHHDVGLALSARANGGRLPDDAFVQRARQSADCLRGLASRYESQPPTACVSLEALDACLGSPLPGVGR